MSQRHKATATPWWESRAQEVQSILDRYPRKRSAIMPLLHLAQATRGYLTDEDFEKIAELIEQTPAYVQSVCSFYALYHTEPKGRYILMVCENLSCALRGADRLVQHLSRRLGVAPGETTPDGLFTLETTGECLAACGGGPCFTANLEYFERVTPEQADRILEALRQAAQEGKPADRAAAEVADALGNARETLASVFAQPGADQPAAAAPGAPSDGSPDGATGEAKASA